MKKFIAIALVTIGVSVSARAQWIVFDPTINVQSILNTAQEVAKFVEMINNQVQQIQTLTDQLNEFKHYESLFDDPKAVLLTTVQPLVNDLRKTEVGETLAAIPEVVEAYLVSGEYDYLLRVAVKDTRDYERLLREKLYKIKGIRHSKSSFVLRTLKKADLPL